MRKILVVLASLWIVPAFAGSLSFQVIDATDGTVTKTYSQFSDAHITRWIAANQTACNIDKNGTCTRAQVLNYIVSKFVADQISLVKQTEDETAANTATTNVSPITVQP